MVKTSNLKITPTATLQGTKLEFWRRIYQHVASIQKQDPSLPLGRHSALIHGKKCPKIKFLALDQIGPSARGGDYNKLQTEFKWIFVLKATAAPGLNEAFNFRPYLPGLESGICELDL